MQIADQERHIEPLRRGPLPRELDQSQRRIDPRGRSPRTRGRKRSVTCAGSDIEHTLTSDEARECDHMRGCGLELEASVS